MRRAGAFLALTTALFASRTAAPAPAPDDQALVLTPQALHGQVEGISVLSAAETGPLPARVLDVAFLADDRLAVLSEEAVALYRREGALLKREARRPHPPGDVAVRAPAGVIRVVEAERAFWVATNALAQVRLFTWDGSRLAEAQQADALPDGVRYRSGTNVLEGGAFGAAARLQQGLAVSPDGRLGTLETEAPSWTWTALRVGDAVARPWPRVVAASSSRPPGEADALWFYEMAPQPRPLGALSVEASIRALAGRGHRDEASLVLAVQGAGGDRLLVLRLGRHDP